MRTEIIKRIEELQEEMRKENEEIIKINQRLMHKKSQISGLEDALRKIDEEKEPPHFFGS